MSMLAGLLPPPLVGGKLPPIQYVSSSSAWANSNVNVARPAGVQAGDFLVLVWFGGVGNTVTPPSGWAQDMSASNLRIFVRKASASEPTSYTFTGAGPCCAVMLAYRNATLVEVKGSVISNANAQSITLTKPGVLLAIYGNSQGTSISAPPSGMVLRGSTTSGPTLFVYDELPSPMGATGIKTVGWGSVNILNSMQLQIT